MSINCPNLMKTINSEDLRNSAGLKQNKCENTLLRHHNQIIENRLENKSFVNNQKKNKQFIS